MHRVMLSLVGLLAVSTAAFATEFAPTSEVPMYAVERWVASPRGSLEQALADFQPGDVLVETGDSNVPWLRLVHLMEVYCGSIPPWVTNPQWFVEIHGSRESAQARADWFQWPSWIAHAPDGTWLLTYRNPDLVM